MYLVIIDGSYSLIAPLTNLLAGYAAGLLTSFAFIGVALISLPSFLKVIFVVAFLLLSPMLNK